MTETRRVGVFHPGTQHSWQTARALRDSGLLEWYATTIYYDRRRWPYKIEGYLPEALSKKAHREFGRFFHPDLNPQQVRTFGLYQWAARMAARAGWSRFADILFSKSHSTFAEKMVDLIKTNPIDAVWGYDTAALETFEFCRPEGIDCILDCTIGHPRVYNRIISEAYENYPEFFSTHSLISAREIDRKDRELELADQVVVGSEFCGRTLAEGYQGVGAIREKIKVIDYCFDDRFFDLGAAPISRPVQHPISFIFVGQAGPRKGLHLLLKAFDRIPRSAASLTVVGNLLVPQNVFAPYAERVRHVGGVPRSEVREFMTNADCMIFPSLFEGSALAVYEALACGLGIIQSENTGIVIDENTGIVLPSLTEEAVYKAIMTVVEDPYTLMSWRTNSSARAANYTYSQYRDAVCEVLTH
ncbi:glycosyltransferase family 4 protein [Bradyrhizobium vignae]|uniref:glycosyltransferase family 4 protein n=1 Tax=Bradyrhizobium vignae TaxID=1549949 RepID=UPI0013E8AD64|nr:glycosyltransferase family 4 protein [Bradyrhizobium vignae]